MKKSALDFFVCPECKSDLTLESPDVGEVLEGTLTCSGCQSRYPITKGVPRFVSEEFYADTFGRQWNRWNRTQLDSYNNTNIFHERFQRWTGWSLNELADEVVVDAGCGPGGYVDVVKSSAKTVIGFDLSSAIDAAYANHGAEPNVHLAQADIFKSPVRPAIADRLFTFGVVQHTPDPERAYRSLIPLVKANGQIAVWVYNKPLVPTPIYIARWFTAGMPEPKATRFIESFVPKAMKLSGILGSVPVIGKILRKFVPVADYRDRLTLSADQYMEWALMDTHDALITRYTYPQSWKDMQRWARDLIDLRKPSPRDMAAVARVPRR
jgi:uncharacterized protein YbaR (Trm112 family)